jgi:hypothetical protein
MSINPSDPPSQVFLVRLWTEPEGDGQTAWRGKVQHLTSGEAHRFSDWADLVAVLQVMLPDLKQTDRARLDGEPSSMTGDGE